MPAHTKQFAAAVLGLGNMGNTHAKAALASPFIDTVFAHDLDSDAACNRGRELGIQTTEHLSDILDNEAIRLVFITCPNECHCDLTVACLKAGKAVLCEKPMGLSLAEGQRILDAEAETGEYLQIGFEARYSQLYQTVHDWIRQGLIGKPLNSHCDYFCSEFHQRDSWRSRCSGSLIGEKLCHYLDLPRWWFNDEVEEVFSAHAPNFVNYFNHPDNHQITCRFRQGAVSTLTFVMGTAQTFDGDPLTDVVAEQADDGHRLSYQVYGTKGAIETDVFRRRIRRWEFTHTPEKLQSKLVETVTFSKNDDQHWFHNVHGQNLDVAKRVACGDPPFTRAHDSFDTMRLVFAAEQSEREHRVIRLSELPPL